MKVFAVIPVYNQSELTDRCLRSLLTHSRVLERVVIIDNASHDETPTLLARYESEFIHSGIPFEIIRNETNLGFGKACNQGIRKFLASTAPFLAIINNDTWLMPDWDQALVGAASHFHLDCVGPYFFEKPFQEDLPKLAETFVWRNRNQLRHHFVPILIGLTRSATVRLSSDCAGSKGGIFDERYFVTYEDTDLLHRMRLQGMRYGQTGACFIWHRSSGTRSQLPSGYEQEGLKLFMEKWGFDPRAQDHTVLAKLRRRYWKTLESFGRF